MKNEISNSIIQIPEIDDNDDDGNRSRLLNKRALFDLQEQSNAIFATHPNPPFNQIELYSNHGRPYADYYHLRMCFKSVDAKNETKQESSNHNNEENQRK